MKFATATRKHTTEDEENKKKEAMKYLYDFNDTMTKEARKEASAGKQERNVKKLGTQYGTILLYFVALQFTNVFCT